METKPRDRGPYENLFKEWRAADRQAHLLEKALTQASLIALETRGEAPSPQQRDRARRLRQAADDLFALAMAEMKSQADRLRR
jgi:hypothetical protein